MERNGTDLDKYRQIENEVHSLRSEIADVRSESKAQMAELAASVGILAKGLDDQTVMLSKLDQKLDEQRTKRPDLLAIFGGLTGLMTIGLVMLGGMWTLFQAQLAPIIEQQAYTREIISDIRDNRWSGTDHQMYAEDQARIIERIREENRIEHENIRGDMHRLEDRVHSLEVEDR